MLQPSKDTSPPNPLPCQAMSNCGGLQPASQPRPHSPRLHPSNPLHWSDPICQGPGAWLRRACHREVQSPPCPSQASMSRQRATHARKRKWSRTSSWGTRLWRPRGFPGLVTQCAQGPGDYTPFLTKVHPLFCPGRRLGQSTRRGAGCGEGSCPSQQPEQGQGQSLLRLPRSPWVSQDVCASGQEPVTWVSSWVAFFEPAPLTRKVPEGRYLEKCASLYSPEQVPATLFCTQTARRLHPNADAGSAGRDGTAEPTFQQAPVCGL